MTPVSDLSITMSASPQPVAAGGTLTYTILATNGGPSADPAAVVVDTLPAGVTFVSATGRHDALQRQADDPPGQPGAERHQARRRSS